MQNTYNWEITPSTWPMIIRNCPKCGSSSEYECSKNFRVNANHNSIDVWLIYQCNKCNNTLNLEIISRTNVKAIDKELYHSFLSNDKELAKYYAFDIATLVRNKANVSYEHVSYEVKGDSLSYRELTSACQIDILCTYPFELRLDRLLVRQLGLSRQQIKNLILDGKIISTAGSNITRLKIKDRLQVILYPLPR